MKRVALVLCVMLMTAAAARAAVFERYLSPDRPEDRAIMAYMKLDQAGTATSNDLAELGVLLLHKGFPKDAERYLDRALDLNRDNFEARYRLGLVYQREGNFRKAVRCYKKVLKQRPGHSYARFMLALAEEQAGHRRAAVHDYAKAYHHDPALALPDQNPLVLDSRLQTSAQLLFYKNEVRRQTLKVTYLDPAAVRDMMAARPAPAGPVLPAPRPTPAPRGPGGLRR